MRIRARLNVMDGKVLCPQSCRWENLENCRHCPHFMQVDQGRTSSAVVCDPKVDRLSTAVERMMRA